MISRRAVLHEHGPLVAKSNVRFHLHDPKGEFERVALYQEVMRPNLGPELRRGNPSGVWSVHLARPAVQRMEYQFLVTRNGERGFVCDPGNPARARGPFGDKSVIEFPGYEPPRWLSASRPPRGKTKRFAFKSRAAGIDVQVVLWSPPDRRATERLPLLVANDGLDYAMFSDMILFLETMTAERRVLPMRAALLQPLERDDTFSASTTFADALAHELIPTLDEVAPVPAGRQARVGMGASLGALAMLHAHRRHPQTFGALYLQSGSYFRPRHERYEGFTRYPWVARFVAQVHKPQDWAYPISVTSTCGTVEENLPNNRAMADALSQQGYAVRLVEHPDAHNWVGWRDTFDPHLVDLLQETWA